jgi:nucleoid-associated protein YgaU
MQPVSAGPRARMGATVYVVEQGDSLFDIARHQLGKASRWVEIYDLNREALGDDFDYLRPGTELVMPGADRQSQDAITRQRGDSIQR